MNFEDYKKKLSDYLVSKEPTYLYGNVEYNYCPTDYCLPNDYTKINPYKSILRNSDNGSLEPILIFAKNNYDKNKLKVKYADKYFHAKANCQAGQYSKNSLNPNALLRTLDLDIGKELFDLYDKNFARKNGLSFKENLLDSNEDLKMDLYGLKKGLSNPNYDCRELLFPLRVNGLPDEY